MKMTQDYTKSRGLGQALPSEEGLPMPAVAWGTGGTEHASWCMFMEKYICQITSKK